MQLAVLLVSIGTQGVAAQTPELSPAESVLDEVDWKTGQVGLAENPLGDLILVHKPDSALLSDTGNQLARLKKGTVVRLANEIEDPRIRALTWKKVEVLSGEFQGKSGWVSGNCANRVYEVRLKTFIPSPVVAVGFEQIMDIPIQFGAVGMAMLGPGGGVAADVNLQLWDLLGNYVGPRVFKGDDRTFDYHSVSYRTFQSIVVCFARSPKAGFVGGVFVGPQSDDPRIGMSLRRFGESAGWRPHKTTWVREHLLWWWELDVPAQPDFGPERLEVTDDNNQVTSDWIDENTIRVEFAIEASNPLLATAPAISARLNVTMEKNGKNVRAKVDGHHDGFPAYELYINGESHYQHDPVSSTLFVVVLLIHVL